MIWLAVALTVFLWHLLDRQLDERRPGWIYLRLAGLSLLFAGTIYAAVWLAFYVPPIAVGLYQMREDRSIENIVQFFRQPLGVDTVNELQMLACFHPGFSAGDFFRQPDPGDAGDRPDHRRPRLAAQPAGCL